MHYTNETGTHTIPLPVQSGGSVRTDVIGVAVMVRICACITLMRLVPILYRYPFSLGAL